MDQPRDSERPPGGGGSRPVLSAASPAPARVGGRSVLLKELLRKRHLLPYRRFCKEYDRVAASLGDKGLLGTAPSERQYMRWLAGSLARLPYSEPCAVLEAMFPGYSVEQLFESATQVGMPQDSVALDGQVGSIAGDGAIRLVSVVANPLEWEMWDETKRRTFLVQAAGTVTTVLTLIDRSLLDSWPSRLARSAGLDRETLEGLEQTTLGLRRAYRSAGALSLLGPSHGTLNLLTEMAPRSGRHQDRVVTAIGQTAALIGVMLTLDLEDFSSGQPYLSVAARAAQQAGNNELLAFTLGVRAFHVAYNGDILAGCDYADSALNIARRGISPIMNSWLCAVASEMHAMDNNEAACRRLLDEAATSLARADPAEPWSGVGVFNADKLVAYQGGDLMRLGRYREAQDVLHNALDQLDPSLAKHRCTAHVDLAEAYAADGKIAEAANHAAHAIAIVANTRHVGSLRRVERLYGEVRGYHTSSTRRLGEKLIEMKAAW